MAKKATENKKFELPETVKDSKLKLQDLRLQIAAGKLKDTSKIALIRKHIARMLTNKDNK